MPITLTPVTANTVTLVCSATLACSDLLACSDSGILLAPLVAV